MLREWLTYLRAGCAPEARQLGYLHEAIAIRERHARHRGAWAPHLSRCRKFVLRAAEQSDGKDVCVILGSGLLLDVPLEELTAMFGKVVLVDIVHLPETRRRLKRHANVKLIEADVTGLVSVLADPAEMAKGAGLPTPSPPKGLLPGGADLVVSLNLLSQLPLNLVAAARGAGGWNETAIGRWVEAIQLSHWDLLNGLADTRCVITDESHTVRDLDGGVREETRMLALKELPAPTEQWTWDLAPFGEIDRQTRTEAMVSAWIDRSRKP
jgi:hypothetical protein